MVLYDLLWLTGVTFLFHFSLLFSFYYCYFFLQVKKSNQNLKVVVKP